MASDGKTFMIQCSQCSREFDPQNMSEYIASISGSIMGDECIETYYYCDRCGVYTVEVFWDYFSGQESASVQGPIKKAVGDEKVAMIKRCSEPWDKKCRCASHQSYFEGSLD
jgi:hypothetical protein